MDKVANPHELQAELRRLLAYCQGPNRPSRAVLATKLNELADRVAVMRVKLPGAERRYAVVDRATGKLVAFVDALYALYVQKWLPKGLGDGEWLVFRPKTLLDGSPNLRNEGDWATQPMRVQVTDGKAREFPGTSSDASHAPPGYPTLKEFDRMRAEYEKTQHKG